MLSCCRAVALSRCTLCASRARSTTTLGPTLPLPTFASPSLFWQVTFEEYQEQRYEGGSTIFGPHQLDGYIEQLLLLADSLANGTAPATDPAPEDFTHRILNTSPGE